MAANAIKCKILGADRWLCFNVAAQMRIAKLHGGSIEQAMIRFADAFYPSDEKDGLDECERMTVVANWIDALTYGGRFFAKHIGEESEAVEADEFFAVCSPYEVGEIASIITEAVTTGQQREVENAPENSAKKK